MIRARVARKQRAQVPASKRAGASAKVLSSKAPEKAGVVSFLLDGHEPVAVGKALDEDGIAVRAGHHCAQPALAHYGLAATVRPSLALYNTHEEIEHLAPAVRRLATS